MSNIEYNRLQRAQLLLQTDRKQEAIKELRGLIADAPDYAPAYAQLARILAKGKTTAKEALALAQRAVELDVDFAYGFYSLAFVCHCLNKFKQADQAILRAIELDMDDPDFPCLRGAMFFDRGRLKDAKTCFLAALAIDPNHQRSLTLLSEIELQLGNHDAAKALAEQAIKNSPEDAAAHRVKGEAMIRSRHHDEAFGSLREALRLDPNDELAKHRFGIACLFVSPSFRRFALFWLIFVILMGILSFYSIVETFWND